MRVRRVLALSVIPVVLVCLAAFDDSEETAGSLLEVPASPALPVALPAGALGSTFYCPVGTGTAGGAFDVTVLVANPNPEPVEARLTIFPGAIDGDAEQAQAIAALGPRTHTLEVPAAERAEVRLGDLVAAPYVAAVVEVTGGEVGVEHRVVSSSGSESAPCASSPSTTWYFPTGTNTLDASEQLALFNPFADDAVIDVRLATSEGFREPPRLQNYVVPPKSLVVLDIDVESPRHEQVAAEIVAEDGRLVVGRLQAYSGDEPERPQGMSATLGAPSLGTAWQFPDGRLGDGLIESYTIFNPANQEAEIELVVTLDDPDVNGTVEPIGLRVAPRSTITSVLNNEPRIPSGIPHTVVVRSRAGPPVAAERLVKGAGEAPIRGLSAIVGSPVVSSRWLFVDGRADDKVGERLVIYNPDPSDVVRAQVFALDGDRPRPIAGLQEIEVLPGARVTIELARHSPAAVLPVVVEANGPVTVERTLAAPGALGFSSAIGIPLAGDVSLLDPAAPLGGTTTTTTAVLSPEVTDAES